MSARVWQIMIKKLTGEQKMLESRLSERKRRALELKSKIQNLESYLQDYLTQDSRDTEFDRKKLLLRESTMAFANQLSLELPRSLLVNPLEEAHHLSQLQQEAAQPSFNSAWCIQLCLFRSLLVNPLGRSTSF